jgi:hypothetical protein
MKPPFAILFGIIATYVVTDASLAHTDDVGALAYFTGTCTKFEDESQVHNYCENEVHDIRFRDGYDSIQFCTPEKAATIMIVTSVPLLLALV